MSRTFFINRDRDTERHSRVKAHLGKAGIPAERIAAVEGASVPAHLRDFFLNPDGLTPGEIGCYASHLVVAQLIVESGLSWALVLEDDAGFEETFGLAVTGALNAVPGDWDIIRLCARPKRAVSLVKSLGSQGRLVRYSRIPVGSAAYLISLSGAQKLLKPRSIRCPFDIEIAQSWLLNLNVFGVDPPPACQSTALATTIGHERRGHRLRTDPRRVMFNVQKLGVVSYVRCLAVNAIGRHFSRSSSLQNDRRV